MKSTEQYFPVMLYKVQFSSVYCFAIAKCTTANYYYLNTNGEEAQGKPLGL